MSSWTDFLASRGAIFDAEAVSRFGAPAEELAFAESGAIVCDLSPLAVLRVAGADAEGFLQGQLTNDVTALAADHTQYSAWCSAKGRMLANFLVARTDENAFDLYLPHSLIGSIAKRLAMFLLRAKVSIADTSAESVRIGVAGPAAADTLRSIASAIPPPHSGVRVGGGLLIALPAGRFFVRIDPGHAAELWEKLQHTARAAGFPVWQWSTIRAGVPVVTPATSDQFIPQVLNWDALGGISFQKGCYAGQEIVARTQYLGRLKERTFLAHVDALPPPAGARLFGAAFGEQACGTVVNAATAPTGGADLLVALQIAARERGDVHLGRLDGPPVQMLPLPYAIPAAIAPRGRMA
ncbi:MAG: folate-binding protein YgfZ [Betaproteobacteria bacterium]|nr:MAG: folate-binding protein YgfZ [Betaproteobacteria bacterium]